MAATFQISADQRRDLVRVSVTGFFETDDITSLMETHRDALMRLRCTPNTHLTLVDTRGLDIQSQESVSGFQQALADRRGAGRRIAFVVAASLARTQVRRAAEGRDAAYFTDESEAEAWLVGDRDGDREVRAA